MITSEMTPARSPHSMMRSKISPKIDPNDLQPISAWEDMDPERTFHSSQPLISEGDSTLSSVEESATERSDCENLTKTPSNFDKTDDTDIVYRWRFPYFICVNVLIQIFIFCFAKENVFKALLYTPRKKHEIWRFFTYALLHTDMVHLVLNVFLQLLVAFVLEMEQGHLRILLVYVGGALAGSLGTSIFQPKLLMVGSSGGVYSLLISHIPHLIMNFSSLSYRYFRIISVIVLCLSDIIFATVHCLQSGNMEPRISLAAHGCGAISGFLLGFMIYTYSNKSRKIIFKFIKLVAIFLYIMCIILAIVINNYGLIMSFKS